MGPLLEDDRSDLSRVCKECLADNPRLSVRAYVRKCNDCKTPFPYFRFMQDDPRMMFICQNCSISKNICQVCRWDLTMMNSEPINLNSSQVIHNSRVSNYQPWRGKLRVTDTIRNNMTNPHYMTSFCDDFLHRGQCARGHECPYRHEMPEIGEYSGEDSEDDIGGDSDIGESEEAADTGEPSRA